MRLVLAGRHLAGLGVAKLRVDGDLAEIGADELACTPAEAQAYFEMLGVELPPAQLDELLDRTQGWITGLRLASLRGETEHEPAAPWRISGDEPLVADYLRDEIMATLPADRRDFLLRTCVCDQICGDLADTLTGGQDGAVILTSFAGRTSWCVRPSAADLSSSTTNITRCCSTCSAPNYAAFTQRR